MPRWDVHVHGHPVPENLSSEFFLRTRSYKHVPAWPGARGATARAQRPRTSVQRPQGRSPSRPEVVPVENNSEESVILAFFTAHSRSRVQPCVNVTGKCEIYGVVKCPMQRACMYKYAPEALPLDPAPVGRSSTTSGVVEHARYPDKYCIGRHPQRALRKG